MKCGRKSVLGLACALAMSACGIEVSEYTKVSSDDLAAYTSAEKIVINESVTLEFSGITDDIALAMPISGGGTLKADSCTSLKLSGDNSTFSGEMVFNKTKVEVAHAKALGTATVDFTNNGYAAVNALLFTAAGTYANDITCSGTWLLDKTKDVVFTGVITLSLSTSRSELGSLNNRDKGSFRFRNKLVRTTGNSNWQIYSYATVYFDEGLVVKGFGDAVTALFINSDANYHIFADLNSPNEMKGTYQKGKIVCERDNILTNGIFTLGTDSSPAATLYLKGGHSQIIDILSAPLGKNPGTFSSSALVTATEEHPATLTIKSAAYGKSAGSGCNVQFDGAVSVEFGDGTKDDGDFCLVNDTITNKTTNTSTERFTSDTTGTIMARSGNLTLGEGCTFTALSGIIVSNGNLHVESGAALNTTDLYFLGTGKLSVADGVELRCDRLFVKDDTKPTGLRQLSSGGYSRDDLSDYIAAGSLEVLSDPPIETEEFHWTGEAADDLLTTPGNWQEAEAPDFAKKNAVLHFANRGDHARLAADGEVRGVKVNAATFALEGSGCQLGIGAGGLSVAAGCQFTNNCGLIAADSEVAWTFGTGAKFTVNGPLASHGALLFNAGGGATFQFDADSPDLEPGIEVTNTAGDDRVVTVTTPYAFGPEGITIYNSMPFFTGGVESNASPIVVRDLQHNTKNQFYSANRFHQSGRLSMYSQKSDSSYRPYVYVKGNLTLSGGVDFHTGRAIFDFASQATLRITNETITADAGVDFRAGSCNENTVYFDTAVTNIGSMLYIGRVRVVCGGENVLPYASSSTVSLGIQSEGTDNDNRMCWIDLNGYDQTIGIVSPPEMSKLAKGDPALAFAEVSSATPATLTHWHTKAKYGGSTKGIPLKVTGQASFTHDVDARTLVISNAVSTTAGTLTVKRGTVQFQSGAGWGGGDVVVKSGAKLDVLADAMSTAFANPAAGVSRSEVNLSIEEGGELSLGEGTVNVRMASYAGQGCGRGYYAAADSSEANATKVNWITGAGKLRVLGTAGTQIILR